MVKAVLLKPIMTEKSLKNTQVYVFEVLRDANKRVIKEVIESVYKVKVKTINTLINKGKIKSVGKKRVKKSLPNRKKAYVTLLKGEITDFPKTA